VKPRSKPRPASKDAEDVMKAHDALLDAAASYADTFPAAGLPAESNRGVELLLNLADAAIVWRRAAKKALSREGNEKP
jgi:hypothetical protein